MSNSALLERYADLAVHVGVNLQRGQVLEINGLVEHAPMARALSKAAWSAGAGYVDVVYRDQHLKRDLIEHGSDEILTHTPGWMLKRLEETAERQGAWIEITGNPEQELFAGLDEGRVGRTRMLDAAELTGRLINEGQIAWSIVSYPTEGWARTVFGEPDMDRLWGAIATAVRLDEADPVEAWRRHMAKLMERAARMNGHAFRAVRYRGPGTDLTVGLNPG